MVGTTPHWIPLHPPVRSQTRSKVRGSRRFTVMASHSDLQNTSTRRMPFKLLPCLLSTPILCVIQSFAASIHLGVRLSLVNSLQTPAGGHGLLIGENSWLSKCCFHLTLIFLTLIFVGFRPSKIHMALKEPLFTRKKFHFFTFYSKNRRSIFFFQIFLQLSKFSCLQLLNPIFYNFLQRILLKKWIF